MPRELSERDVTIVALDAGVDVRTVRRALEEEPRIRSRSTRIAIAAALKKHRFYEQARALEVDDG
jgi:DNA-binding LacI/PurR family transcriptional regulator